MPLRMLDCSSVTVRSGRCLYPEVLNQMAREMIRQLKVAKTNKPDASCKVKMFSPDRVQIIGWKHSTLLSISLHRSGEIAVKICRLPGSNV